MTDHNTANEEWAQAAREDYDVFAAKREWNNCQAVIDSLRENGFEHKADILRKDLINTQHIVSVGDWLEKHHKTEEDVQDDASGRKFIIVEEEEEGGAVMTNKWFLP